MRISRQGKVVVGVFLACCLFELGVVLYLNAGTFSYTLDDPYVHLALAESIAGGSYELGQDAGGGPASSPAWPFLLAVLARTPAGEYWPLVLNVAAAVGVLLVLDGFTAGLQQGRDSGALSRYVLLLGAIPAFNLLGIVLTGMEHPLQLLAATGTVAGLTAGALTTERENSPALRTLYAWTPFWVIAGPLIRYENLALSAPALLLLWSWGRRREAVIAVTSIAAGLGAFSGLLLLSGKGWLPTSVWAKTRIGFEGLAGPLAQLQANLTHRQGALLALGVALLIFVVADPSRSRRPRQLAAWGATAGGLHLAFGSFGWFSRYEIYVWAVVAILLVSLWHRRVRASVASPRGALLAHLLVAVTCLPYLYASLLSPLAANNIYEQHFQMHRLVTEYLRTPVAANDIGRISFENEYAVVDLAGLASPDALVARRQWRGADWMELAAERGGATVVLIYESWFPQIPTEWLKLGELHLGKPRITPSNSTVSIFVRDPTAVTETRQALRRFAPTLPSGVTLELSPSANAR